MGLSIDGPAELHDIHRYNKGGKPTHAKVMQAAALLRISTKSALMPYVWSIEITANDRLMFIVSYAIRLNLT